MDDAQISWDVEPGRFLFCWVPHHVSLQPCQHSAEPFHEGKHQPQITKGDWSQRLGVTGHHSAKAIGEGVVTTAEKGPWGMELFKWNGIVLWSSAAGHADALEAAARCRWAYRSAQRAGWEKKHWAPYLTVTRWKCLTLCLQSWVGRLNTRKLHRISDGMLLYSLYHFVFNFFPRVMGQWLESNKPTSSCLW